MSTILAESDRSPAEQLAPDAGPTVRRRRPSPSVVLGIASLGSAVAFVDATVVNIAFPNIAHSFPDTSIASLSWVLNAYNIVFAAFLVPAGRIADLLGRRRVFVFGLELFTTASLLCAVAPSANALVLFRAVQALGAACLVPSALGLVLSAFEVERRSHGVALLSAVGAAAAGLGPSLGGLLVAAGGWRLVFLINLPIGAAAVVLARRRLIESRAPGRRRMPDLLGAVLFALATGLLVFGVIKGPDWGWGDPRVVGSFVAAVMLGACFAWRCSWHRAPIIDPALLRVRSTTAANAMTVIGAAGYFGYTLTNVLFLTGVWRYSVLQAGLALTPGPFVAVAVAPPVSRLVLRIGYRPVLVAGGLIWGAGVLWFVEKVGATPAFVSEWLPGMIILGIGAGTLFPNLSAAAVASAPGERFATATGLNSVARQVGAALGVALVVAIIGTPSPLHALAAFDDAWRFAAACLIGAGLGCLLVTRVRTEGSPALADAARAVLRDRPALESAPAPLPRARRSIIVDAVAPARPSAESTADFLANVPIFSGLEPSLLEELATRASSVRVPAGEWLFHEGDPGDAMYVVRAGRLDVIERASSLLLGQLGRGDAVGELALLTGSPRAASVRASRASDLLAIGRTDFEDLLRGSATLSLALTRVLGEQLRASRSRAPTTRPRPATVALVALDDRIPLTELSAQLAAELSRQLSPAVLDGTEVAAPSSEASPASVFAPLLDRVEARHDLVVLTAGSLSAPDVWTEFCLQQADRILAVTGGGPPPPAVAERHELRGCDLVLYDTPAESGAVKAIAEMLEPIESHVLRQGQLGGDLARTARRLSGRSVGIVLSGGGARAFSHIGVIEELEGAGVAIDRVAGVSMGAFIGALLAMEVDADEIDAICFEEWIARRPLNDYTIPRHALIRGERFKAMLHRTFGSLRVEELPRAFTCSCTELRSGRLVTSRHGPLWEAVGFSMCLPIIAPPQVRGRDIFTDGSLVDNLPVHEMAQLGEGPIIAVDVKPSGEHSVDGGSPRHEIGRARTPSLGETLTRVLLLGSSNTSEAARRHADLIVKPRVEGIGLLEFHQMDAAREAGRAAARAALEQSAGALFT